MESLACPKKFRHMGDFQKYYDGKKETPVLTIFIGGNHEASNYLNDLYFGGWVAPNIYYLGHSGVLRLKKNTDQGESELILAGFSGIFKGYDFNRGYYETYPFD